MANFFKATAKKQGATQRITVKIDRLDLNGCGVAKFKNKPVFIAGSLPGEEVEATLFEQKNKYSRAKLVNIKNVSPHRVEPKCKHFYACGGCDLQHISIAEQLHFKQNKVATLFERQQINLTGLWKEALVSEPWHYRRKARIGVQFDKNNVATIGFRRKATNQLVAIKHCPILVKPLTDVFKALKKLITALSLPASIGHIEAISTQQVTLVVRQLKRLNEHDTKIWQQYAQQYLWQVLIDDGKTLQPLENMQHNLLCYSLGVTDNQKNDNQKQNIKITFTASDFIQVNHAVNLAMVEQALSWLNLQAQDNVLDLFCGLGNFSLAMARQVSSVVGIEGIQSMVDKAALNAKDNQLNNCQFYQADLNSDWSNSDTKNAWTKQRYHKVLLDPARAGAEQAVEHIIQRKIPIVLYVSCDPTTLARDAKLFLASGYQIDKIAIIDMFAQTKHIETMVLFSHAISAI